MGAIGSAASPSFRERPTASAIDHRSSLAGCRMTQAPSSSIAHSRSPRTPTWRLVLVEPFDPGARTWRTKRDDIDESFDNPGLTFDFGHGYLRNMMQRNMPRSASLPTLTTALAAVAVPVHSALLALVVVVLITTPTGAG